MTSLDDMVLAVVAELNAGTFSREFVARAVYHPEFERTELASLQVIVVPKALVIEALGRGQVQLDLSVDVGIQTDYPSDASVGGLIRFSEELARHFLRLRPATLPVAVWVRTEHGHIYVPEHLAREHVFTSVFTLTFRVIE